MKAAFEKIPTAEDASFRLQLRDDPAFRFAWRFHPEFELTLIGHSRGRRFVGDDIAAYADGDLVLIGPDMPHSWVSDPVAESDPPARHTAVVVQFARDFMGPAFLERPELLTVRLLLDRARHGLQFSGAARDRAAPLMQRLAGLAGLARLLALLEILRGLAEATQLRPLSSAGFTPSLRSAEQSRIDAICRDIQAQFREPLSPRDMAVRHHVSPRSFTRLFLRNFNKTFTAYVTELRIGHACTQLIATDHRVTEICYESGFNNLAHFNRSFRELKQTPPQAYRAEVRQRDRPTQGGYEGRCCRE